MERFTQMSTPHPKNYIGKKDYAEPLKLTNNQIFFEGVSIQKLAETLGTRIYLLSLDQLKRNAQRLQEAFKNYPSFKPCYALAANHLPQVAQTLVDQKFGIEVVNIYELKYTLTQLKNVPYIICNGASKSWSSKKQDKNLIQTVISLQKERNITLNFNSIEEIKYAKNLCQKQKTELEAGISLNLTHHIQNYEKPSGATRFGIPPEQLPQAIKLLKNSKIKITSLQSHIGTQITQLQKLVQNAQLLSQYATQITKKLGTTIENLNLGGGIAVNYYKTENHPLNPNYTIEEYAKKTTQQITKTYQENKTVPPTIIIETGRWLTANIMIFLIKATEISKPLQQHPWIITDGSALTDTNDAVWIAQHFEIINATKPTQKPTQYYNISGITCDSNDAFAWSKNNTGPRKLPKTQPGDILIVLDVGAYQLALRNAFNLLPKAPIYTPEGKAINEPNMEINSF
ncbi:MAG: hypothetical protein KIH08_10685 [Candidatus Freyarchaeota archaeon]|nr:hypothetical protein [Candidatus Jordarchaeia archaeon]MBS7269065.1 hypothetical protein [Candidatus Jordarchaeia archaeon]MBS7279893.1 hypothetical protein [Candidatus Jordarchaeia archaeon]